MIDLDAIADTLKETGAFKSTGSMENAAAAMRDFKARAPAAYPITASESAKPNRKTGSHDQRVQSTIGILFVVKAAHATRQQEVERLLRLIIYTLAGTKPEGAITALDYQTYRIIGIRDGLVWAQVNFTAEWRLMVAQ